MNALQPIFDTLPPEMSAEERGDAIAFITAYRDVFSQHEYDLGRTDLMTHHIDTGEARPIRQSLRRHPQTYLDVIDEEVEKMQKCGVIEPSCSPWASNVVVVTKQDKTPRITLDYRQLNDVTRKDSYPLPNIADCLDAFKGASRFGVLDLRSSFYQVPLADEDRDKTAFITRRGQWRFRSLPMGLSNSPGTFQRLMDLVLRGLTWSSVLVYIDDIVVYAASNAELKERLESVFLRLRAANLKLKPSKVKLFQREITFLGHRISAAGVAMDEGKTSEIDHWPTPSNVHEVRQFVGLCSYYRRYVKDFAKHAGPLHDLTKKEEPFVWTDERQAAFDELKRALTSAPVLAMSQDEGMYVLDVDASDKAVGAVLQQEQGGMTRVIGYASRGFSESERNYCITRKELAAIIFGLKQYRQYLLGRRFVVRTDHAALTYLRSAKELIGQQARWLNFLEEFDFELRHRAGASHGNADSLSRKTPCERAGNGCTQCYCRGNKMQKRTFVNAVTTRARGKVTAGEDAPKLAEDKPEVAELPKGNGATGAERQEPPKEGNQERKAPAASGGQASGRARRAKHQAAGIAQRMTPWTTEFLATQQRADRDVGVLWQWVAAGCRPAWEEVRALSPAAKAYWHQFESMELWEGLIHRKMSGINGAEPEPVRQLVLPSGLREEFLDIVHRGVAGHLGAFKTRDHIGRRSYWYQWRQFVDMYCQRCHLCNEYHRGRMPPRQGQLKPMAMGAPVERWACDLAGPFPKSARGHVYILTCIDVFTKFVVLVPLRDKTAVSVAKAIMENVFLKFGAGEILTDNGCEFRCELLSELCRLMGVARSFTTSYQARTNGVCERHHATVNSMLAKCVDDNQKDWSDHLAYVAFCYNASRHESTKFSPHFLLTGFHPRWDADFKIGTEPREQYSVNDYADTLMRRLEGAHEMVRGHLRVTAERMKDWYDKKVHAQSFQVDDQVYVLNQRLYPGRCPKWVRRYSDVAVVVKKINNVTYEVYCAQWGKKYRIVHVDKLKLKAPVSGPKSVPTQGEPISVLQ